MSLDNFTGVYREYHDEEKTKIESEVFMANGKKEGVYKSYHNNGKLWEEVHYIYDKKMGFIKNIMTMDN